MAERRIVEMNPQVLFRYVRVNEWLDDLLQTRRLYFASPFAQNDIFECRYNLDFDRPAKEVLTFLGNFLSDATLRSQLLSIWKNENDVEALRAVSGSYDLEIAPLDR